jgi:hypothetical protein
VAQPPFQLPTLGGLLPAEDRVFRRLRDAELHDAFGRNLNLRARGRIATDAGFAIHEHEFAQAGERERILRFLVRQLSLQFLVMILYKVNMPKRKRQTEPVIDTYRQHMEKLVACLPANKELVQHAFLDRESADRVCMVLLTKTKQTAEDGEYHNAIIGFPLPFEAPSFCIVEVGCSRSVDAFADHWAKLKFDSYQDYVHGILYVDGKGFDLFEKMTGETLPASPTRETVSRFLVGHVLKTEKEKMLFTSVIWLPAKADYGITVFPSELLDQETRTARQTVRHFVLTREEIKDGAVERLLFGIVKHAEAAGGLSKIQGKIVFSVAGYDTDPRELWEIPEVRAYFAKLDKQAPFILYYIANESHAPMVRVFLKMFVPPSYFGQTEVSDETRRAIWSFLTPRLNAVAKYCAEVSDAEGVPVDPDETAYLTLRCCGMDVTRENVKRWHA